MFTNPEQFANATKTLFELQMETFNALASKAVQGVEQVVALNMATAKNSMEGAMATSRQMSQAADPKAAIDTLQSRMQPGVQNAQAYGEELRRIVGDIQKDFQQAADTHLVEAKNGPDLRRHPERQAGPGKCRRDHQGRDRQCLQGLRAGHPVDSRRHAPRRRAGHARDFAAGRGGRPGAEGLTLP